MTAEKIDAAMHSIGKSGLVYKTELENMQQLENSRAFAHLQFVAAALAGAGGRAQDILALAFSAGIDVGRVLGQAEALENMHKGA